MSIIEAVCGFRDNRGRYEASCLDATGSWQASVSSAKECVNFSSSTTALINAPNDQRLATTTVTSSEDSRLISGVFLCRCLNVRTAISLDIKRFQQLLLWTKESQRKEDFERGRTSQNLESPPSSIVPNCPWSIRLEWC